MFAFSSTLFLWHGLLLGHKFKTKIIKGNDVNDNRS